jgi:hypothetical protein
MEIILAFISILFVASLAAAMFCFAEARSNQRYIVKQDELIKTLRLDLLNWQNKALQRQGISPLGNIPRPTPPKDDTDIAPRILHRGQAQARIKPEVVPAPVTTPIDIHASGVNYPSVKREVIEKAEEIINATKN